MKLKDKKNRTFFIIFDVKFIIMKSKSCDLKKLLITKYDDETRRKFRDQFKKGKSNQDDSEEKDVFS